MKHYEKRLAEEEKARQKEARNKAKSKDMAQVNFEAGPSTSNGNFKSKGKSAAFQPPARVRRVKQVYYHMFYDDPDYDLLISCDICEKEYRDGKCPEHGGMTWIPNAKVQRGIEDRARETLPGFLRIGNSLIPKAGLGVFANEMVPNRVVLGPYEGEEKRTENGDYSWRGDSVASYGDDEIKSDDPSRVKTVGDKFASDIVEKLRKKFDKTLCDKNSAVITEEKIISGMIVSPPPFKRGLTPSNPILGAFKRSCDFKDDRDEVMELKNKLKELTDVKRKKESNWFAEQNKLLSRIRYLERQLKMKTDEITRLSKEEYVRKKLQSSLRPRAINAQVKPQSASVEVQTDSLSPPSTPCKAQPPSTQTTMNDGKEVLERELPDGTLITTFSDGRKETRFPIGKVKL